MELALAETRRTETSAAHPHPTQADRFRPDIQGLRAVAVGVVVLYHLWPYRLSGGYVGVDVFFVISGYLITSHLWREAKDRGRIALRSFYARRALRLLPASLLVLACTAVASLLILPDGRWGNTFKQIVASAAYVQNWQLARNETDYLLQDAADSPVQHFWSLSVEEQFYAVWPLLIIATLWLVTRSRAAVSEVARRRSVMVALGLLLIASLAYSVYETAAAPNLAYFVTPTRVWEFAIGAMCALLVLDENRWVKSRIVLGWLGLGAIIFSACFYTKTTSFPGHAALLPTLGAAAVILGARRPSPVSVSWWLGRRPATTLGDISYAIYLWHWPLLILVPIAIQQDLSMPLRLTILAATIVISWLSTHLFETPIRQNNFLRSRRWPSLAIAAGGVATMLAAAVAAWAIVDVRIDIAEERFASAVGRPCYGAAVFDDGTSCPTVFGEGPIMPASLAVKDQSNPEYERCSNWVDTKEIRTCEFGQRDSAVRVAFVGDSHALQWLGAIENLAGQGRWHATTFFKTSCALAEGVRDLPSHSMEYWRNCAEWGQEVTRRLIEDDGLDAVIVTANTLEYKFLPSHDGQDGRERADEAFGSAFKKITSSGKKVVVIRDTPSTNLVSIPECVGANMNNLHKCALPREAALPYDQLVQSALNAGDPNVRVIDLSDGFCDKTYCYGVAGNVIVYRDTNHLTWQYAETLTPRLWSEFNRVIGAS
ncbi:acyltransferase [Micromonospora zamorensis]|uniref:acyltransferase family protein n=1 Tax=Micromonospora zamorensis TaxID=709883 RepID=UPI00352A7C1E|nr:acyltransferase [Micromonospora zamorensis]